MYSTNKIKVAQIVPHAHAHAHVVNGQSAPLKNKTVNVFHKIVKNLMICWWVFLSYQYNPLVWWEIL